MWESDFGAVDGAIASCFQNSKEIRIFRVQDNTLERYLSIASISKFAHDCESCDLHTLRPSIPDILPDSSLGNSLKGNLEVQAH